jgi:hypothetical protein
MASESNSLQGRRWSTALTMAFMACVYGSALLAQSEQVVEVTIKDSRFITRQSPLRLGLPTVITVRNEDAERHDFSSTMFSGLATKIEKDGVIVYGPSLSGVMLDPKRDAVVRFELSRPGRHEFRCSIHPNMKGELLILSAEAV